jgi:hypothetical protein
MNVNTAAICNADNRQHYARPVNANVCISVNRIVSKPKSFAEPEGPRRARRVFLVILNVALWDDTFI